jgi:hypothetical protein
MTKSILLAVFLLFVIARHARLSSSQDDAPTDAENCKDSPLISRFVELVIM